MIPHVITLPGHPCDQNGEFLPAEKPLPAWEQHVPNDFTPFKSKESFLLADLLFRQNEMPRGQIDDLLQYWAKTLPPDCDPPFMSADNLYETIDSLEPGDISWQSFSVSYQAKEGETQEAMDDMPWKFKTYDVWYRDPREILKCQLSNQDFTQEMDFAAKQVLDSKTGIRRFQDFMSGEWAWEQSVCLSLC